MKMMIVTLTDLALAWLDTTRKGTQLLVCMSMMVQTQEKGELTSRM